MEGVSHTQPKGNRFINILIFIGLLILVSSPMIFVGAIINSASSSGNTWSVIRTVIMGAIWTALMIWLFRWYYRKRSYESHHHQLKLKDIGINLLWFIGMRMVIAIFSYIMLKVYGEQQSQNDEILIDQFQKLQHLSVSTVIAFLSFFIVLIFVAPYLEETLFRGIFKETIFKKTVFVLPMIISSFLFSSLHGSTNWISFLMYMALGIVLYMAYHRRRSLKDSMMVHMLNNAFAGVTMIIMIYT